MNEKDEHAPLSKFPKGIAIGLILVGILISTVPFIGGFRSEQFFAFSLQLTKTFLGLPLLFVGLGWLLRLLDKSFSLWNMYYCGVFMSIILSLRGLSAW